MMRMGKGKQAGNVWEQRYLVLIDGRLEVKGIWELEFITVREVFGSRLDHGKAFTTMKKST